MGRTSVPYVGDFGTVILLQTNDPIPPTAIAVMRVLKPDGTRVTWAATISPGTDGYAHNIEYTIAPGDLDIPGDYRVQVELTDAGLRLLSDPIVIGVRMPYT